MSCTSQGPTMTVTGVDMKRDGSPDVLQHSQFRYAAHVQYTAPAIIIPHRHLW